MRISETQALPVHSRLGETRLRFYERQAALPASHRHVA